MKGAGSTRVRDAQLGMRQRRSHQKSLHRQMRSVRIWGPAGRVTANGRAERIGTPSRSPIAYALALQAARIRWTDT